MAFKKNQLKPREKKDLPPEKLYVILRNIYPKEIADEKYRELLHLEPPKEDENADK